VRYGRSFSAPGCGMPAGFFSVCMVSAAADDMRLRYLCRGGCTQAVSGSFFVARKDYGVNSSAQRLYQKDTAAGGRTEGLE